MLQSLHIENIAVIKCADIDFDPHFTALTGETGAGKSVMLDSILLLLGGKADRELIRTGETGAMVSGLFGSIGEGALKILSTAGVYPDEDGNILIQRNIGTDGRSAIRINGRGVTLSVLRAVSPALITMHGQGDNGEYSDRGAKVALLDRYAGCAALLSDYAEAYSALEECRREIKENERRRSEGERLREILAYQLKDIDSAGLTDGELEELIDRKAKIKNSERIIKNAGFVYKALRGSEKGSVAFLLDRSAQALKQISDVIPDFAAYAERLTDFLYRTEDIAESVHDVISEFDADPEETLNEIETRLDRITKLQRKYGATIADILAFREKIAAELQGIENSDEIATELAKREEELYTKAAALADRLHEARLSAAREIGERVKDSLGYLDMPKATFYVTVSERRDGGKYSLDRLGYDEPELFFSANAGADPAPLSKTASGGEMSRVMLALRSVIADSEGAGTLIFDEIDAGVSGKTARKIGIRMLALSRASQVICVTHSAQIASLADLHLLITKTDVGGKTETSVRALDDEGRIAELSRVLGGIKVTDSQRAAAVDMLLEREEYRKAAEKE